MFEYCSRNIISINSTIGNFLSHQVSWEDSSGELLNPDVINEWDRYSIARRYLNEYFCPIGLDENLSAIGGKCNEELFIEEVALKIDELIPKRYFVKYCLKHNIYNSGDGREIAKKFTRKDDYEFTRLLKYKILKEEPQIFKFERNSVQATDKQISYLLSLSEDTGFIARKDLKKLTIQEASELIGFFKDDIKQPEFLMEYFQYE